jgi:hypothetical protein
LRFLMRHATIVNVEIGIQYRLALFSHEGWLRLACAGASGLI